MRRERSIAMMTGLAVVAIRPVAFIQRSLLVIFWLISCYPSDGLLHQHHHQSTFNVGRKVVVSETITPKRSSVFRAKRADNNENDHKEDSSMPPAPSSMSWNEHFLQLVEFGKEHGHVRVPKRHPRGLGEWVSRQRQRKSRLHAAQIELLDSIGFCWNASGDKQQKETEQWWQRLESVRQQVQQSPIKSLEECLTPSQLIWLRRQRNEYVDFYQLHYTKNCKLSEQQIEALNEVDPSWWKTASERKWDLHFEALQLYYKEHGHCDVPATYKDKQLANWVQLTRKKYKHVKLKELETSLGNNQSFSSYMPTSSVASLAKDQILKLDKIGFSYDVRGEYDDKYIEYLRNPC